MTLVRQRHPVGVNGAFKCAFQEPINEHMKTDKETSTNVSTIKSRFTPTNLSCSSDCFGVLDCEWCTVDSDGKTHLDKPYCALQKECFGGIVGAKSPYADGLGLMGE